MEYIQTVLVQIEATRIDDASRPEGLLAELDEHRDYLQQQAGFEDMRVTRSINAEGNVLLVVETRWRDDDSLVDYETREPNVMSIINKHQNITVANSVQVLDMEALRTGAARPIDAETAARERLALPMLVPLGILAFILLLVYGLSRIYLELSSGAGTGLAAGIALGILAVAWYLASRPSVPAWQIGFISMAAAALLTGGAIWAIVQDDDGEATAETPGAAATPAADESPAPGGPPGGLAVRMGDNFFELEGEREPTIIVAAGEEITIDLGNDGQAIHNLHIAGTDNEYGVNFCERGGEEPCSDPELFTSGDAGTITFSFDQPGTFIFRCDFHPIEMTGEIEVQ